MEVLEPLVQLVLQVSVQLVLLVLVGLLVKQVLRVTRVLVIMVQLVQLVQRVLPDLSLVLGRKVLLVLLVQDLKVPPVPPDLLVGLERVLK